LCRVLRYMKGAAWCDSNILQSRGTFHRPASGFPFTFRCLSRQRCLRLYYLAADVRRRMLAPPAPHLKTKGTMKWTHSRS
jgi:hypothetical protein